MRRRIPLLLLALVTNVWAAYQPQPVQRTTDETQLTAALAKAADAAEKQALAEQALADHPEHIPIGILAQDVLTKQLDDAKRYFRARAEGSSSIAKKFLAARASGDSAQQMETANWILAQDPRNFWGYLLKGQTLWYDDPDIMLHTHALFDSAIAADPSRPEGYFWQGVAYLDEHNHASARAALEAGLVCDPNDAVIRDNLLTVYAANRDAGAYFPLAERGLPAEPLHWDLPFANKAGQLTAQDVQSHVSVIEYWAYT